MIRGTTESTMQNGSEEGKNFGRGQKREARHHGMEKTSERREKDGREKEREYVSVKEVCHFCPPSCRNSHGSSNNRINDGIEEWTWTTEARYCIVSY